MRILNFSMFSIFAKIFFHTLVHARVNFFKKSAFLANLAILREIAALAGKQTNFFFEIIKIMIKILQKKFSKIFTRVRQNHAFLKIVKNAFFW